MLTSTTNGGLNPFRTGRCLSTLDSDYQNSKTTGLNPFRTGRCLSTLALLDKLIAVGEVSIPFEQGDVFRQERVHHATV